MWFIMFYFCNTAAISTIWKRYNHRHLQWYSSCRLLSCHTSGVVRVAVSDISNLCWKGAFVVFYLWDTHVMSTWSIGVKALTCRHLQCCFCCRLINLFHRITVNLPAICGVGQFEGKATRERFGRNAHAFYQLFLLCEQVFLVSYI